MLTKHNFLYSPQVFREAPLRALLQAARQAQLGLIIDQQEEGCSGTSLGCGQDLDLLCRQEFQEGSLAGGLLRK